MSSIAQTHPLRRKRKNDENEISNQQFNTNHINKSIPFQSTLIDIQSLTTETASFSSSLLRQWGNSNRRRSKETNINQLEDKPYILVGRITTQQSTPYQLQLKDYTGSINIRATGADVKHLGRIVLISSWNCIYSTSSGSVCLEVDVQVSCVWNALFVFSYKCMYVTNLFCLLYLLI